MISAAARVWRTFRAEVFAMPLRWRSVAGAVCLLMAGSAMAGPFGFEQVVDKARRLSSQPYVPPPPVPEVMRSLSYDEFRQIRSHPDKTLWRDSGSRFEVMPMMAGLFFSHAVKINIIGPEGARPLRFSRGYFQVDSPEVAKKIPADVGYAGFKLTYPINRQAVRDQFFVFAGASYFRGVGRGDNFGLSARGLAVDTGQMSGEEFPSFVEYWLVKPPAGADRMKFYALLDSRRISGAYEFTVYPGQPTRLDVRAMLIPRKPIDLMGVAPLTSMFFYGENTPLPPGEWRREVHDSDGLLIHNGTGEWLWNPLHNPMNLHIQSFAVRDLKGFGLMQRDKQFVHYQDAEAHYERRPSAWVTPLGKWGYGRVVLVEIPTGNETNDNMVAFWSPQAPVDAGRELRFRYRVAFGDNRIAGGEVGRAVDTYIGRGDVIGGGNVPGAYRVVVDFKGGPLPRLKPGTPVMVDATAQEGGEILEKQARYIKDSGLWRLSLLARPATGRPLALRAALRTAEGVLTETWTYTLPVPNAVIGERR